MLKAGDIQELEHLHGGGSWCLDGRKARRLRRLGLIEPNLAGYGWLITQAGIDAIKAEADRQDEPAERCLYCNCEAGGTDCKWLCKDAEG